MSLNSKADNYDYLIERRLKSIDPALHERYRNSVFAIDHLLANYKNIFPFFTNHTFEHSAQVIRYCNIIAGNEIVDALNADELYILLLGAALHDIGMGVSEADFAAFAPEIPTLKKALEEKPGLSVAEYTRQFHQELSARFIIKYHRLFEIPSESHLFCITQIARGHRKLDLLDESEFPSAYRLENGSTVNLAYLTALVKLADELDIASDRNLMFDYSVQNKQWSPTQTLCYKCHNAIKRFAAEDERLVLYFYAADRTVRDEVMLTAAKVERTFASYNAVMRQRTSFPSRLQSVIFEEI